MNCPIFFKGIKEIFVFYIYVYVKKKKFSNSAPHYTVLERALTFSITLHMEPFLLRAASKAFSARNKTVYSVRSIPRHFHLPTNWRQGCDEPVALEVTLLNNHD